MPGRPGQAPYGGRDIGPADQAKRRTEAAMEAMMREKIRGFLAQNRKIDGLADGDDLFEKGFVNSLFALQLIMFLEKEFKTKIPNALINEGNFRSVDAIVETLSKASGGNA
jgi:acyl carrier protein